MSGSTREEWEQTPRDPESISEGEQGLDEWKTIRTDRCGRQHLVFLPRGSPEKDRESFIIVEEADVMDPLENR